MPELEWISDPGTKAQASATDVQYFVLFPSIMVNMVDPSQSFSEPKLYMATAMKTAQGMPASYVVGHGFNNVQQAERACQEDFNRYGTTVPPDKMPPPPPSLTT